MESRIILVLPYVLAVALPQYQALGFIKLVGRREAVEIIRFRSRPDDAPENLHGQFFE
jgi:hypothetical protein